MAGIIDSIGGIVDIGTGLFGTAPTEQLGSKKGTTRTKGGTTTTERLKIDREGIDAIIADLLGGTQGLASIFSDEQVSGLFSSSVAAQASGDLISQIAGELAKLTGVKETKEDIDITESIDIKEESETGGTGGLFGSGGLGGILGF